MLRRQGNRFFAAGGGVSPQRVPPHARNQAAGAGRAPARPTGLALWYRYRFTAA